MFCKNCGKEINNESVFCPHCGKCNAEQQSPALSPNYNNTANYSSDDNICAILGLVFAFLIPLAGLILSCIGLKKPKYHGLAVAGLVISIIFIVIVFIAAIASASADSYYYY